MSFLSFPSLPPELRLRIWELAISGVYVELSGPKLEPNSDSTSPSLISSASQQHRIARCADHGVPPILHVNHEARAFGLEHYILLHTPKITPSFTHFNPTLDTLLLSSLFHVDFFLETKDRDARKLDVGLVQHVAYHQPYDIGWAMDPSFIDALKGRLRSFTFLSMDEWEVMFYPEDEEVREVMTAQGGFRAERLVKGKKDWDRRNPWCESVKATGRKWGRELEVGVVRLPVPEELKREWERKKVEEEGGVVGGDG